MRWTLFFILASAAVAFSDDQLLQQAMKNNALLSAGKLDVVRFTNYSARTQLKLNGKTSTVRFTNLSSSIQTKLNGKVDKTVTVNGQALSGNVTVATITGNAGTSTALAANGTNCSAGQAALGVDASGNSEGCWTPAGTYTLPTATSSVLGGVKPDGTTIINTSGAISVANPLNQNTTGSAARLTTARTINGVNFDGTANILVNPAIKIGTFTRSTATGGTQAITGVGFQPSKVIFVWGVVGSNIFGVGMDDGTTSGGVDGSARLVAGTYGVDNAALTLWQSAAYADYYTGKISAFGADGFTMNWTKVGAVTETITVYYMAFR